jgi:hypothetical protein
MPRSYEEYEYDDDDIEDNRRGPRRFRKEEKEVDKKKRWEQEEAFDGDHDYDERR